MIGETELLETALRIQEELAPLGEEGSASDQSDEVLEFLEVHELDREGLVNLAFGIAQDRPPEMPVDDALATAIIMGVILGVVLCEEHPEITRV
jgi:hypothetical protein